MTNVAVFYNNSIVDTVNNGAPYAEAEAVNMVAVLQAQGHAVTTFTGIGASEISTALAGKGVLVIPEMEHGSLANRLNSNALTAIRDFVKNGGTIVVAGDGYTYDTTLLNTLFSFNLQDASAGGSSVSPSADNGYYDVGNTLPGNDAIYAFSNLPAGSQSLYGTSSATTAALMPYGGGTVAFLAYDWFDAAPNGGQDGGWNALLNKIVTKAGVAPNAAPDAVDDAVSVSENGPGIVIALTGNDTDSNGDDVEVTGINASGLLGSVQLNADKDGVTYDPNGKFDHLQAGQTATETFTYTVTDGKGGTDTATVTVTITGANDAPVVVKASLSPALGACDTGARLGSDDLKASDVDSAKLTYTVTAAAAGVLLIDGEIAGLGSTFTQGDVDAGHVQLLGGPGTSDAFGFMVRDEHGGETAGLFTAAYGAFDTVQTVAQWGGYWGGNGNDYQLGTAAADNMSGGNGCDTMVGGAGNDQMNGGEGNNRLFGQDGNDSLTGGNGNDLLDGGANDDQLHANGGNNWLFGGAGNDTMTAGEGNDRMFGGAGNDTIHANGGANRIDAGAGDDYVTAGSGNDTIVGGAGNDRIFDNGGTNKFQLGGIKDFASDGNDEYNTGSGADKFALFLDARDGSDAGWGNDTINGFRIAQGDQLVAFNDRSGFWDDRAALSSLVASDFVNASRGTGGNAGDLTLTFGSGEAASSLTMKWFFWDNGSFGTTNGSSTVTDAQLVDILDAAVTDGGASGPDFLAQAHDSVSHDFMLA